MPTELSATNQTPPARSQILEDAWFRFAKYDKNAIITQRRFVQQRKWILGLGVAATTLAVLYSTVERYLTPDNIGFPVWIGSWFSKQQFLDSFHFVVIAVPILVTVLVAFSEKFNMGISWVMLRSSAEAIKKEIYRYRMQVEEYDPSDITSSETRDVRLAKKMKIISRRLMETSVNQTDLLPYKGELPPQYSTPKGDNGFDDMTAEQYLQWRVEDQFDYYQKKAARLGKDLRRFQLLIILLGGIGALLAAINLNIWLAVSNALAIALTNFLEFKRVESNVISCNLAAADLYDIRIWWHALSPEARKERANVETLVSSTEAVLQTENAGWLQEMREALAEIYKERKDTYKELPGLGDSLAATTPATSNPPPPEFQPRFTRDTLAPEPAPVPVESNLEQHTPTPPAPEASSSQSSLAEVGTMPDPGIFTEFSPEVASTPGEQPTETEPVG
ncbi:MAG: DUF4231 domain-containing protein [Leptolyngbyaceae cyanobacterium HOT.MB2.61]|jgi:hypothetical protein|nr:DUF4231 domain-containing protein [Leptolyngbyaceae cyanobacterium HOT.MB2.61]